ncbi:MAG: DPP IV N-terminal domain-containing protein, partial [Myxococcales bacterium]|nr:DPP IV N-terminal domain-containing protein [Myxococcales bacterium]
VDEARKRVYFTAGRGDPTQRHLHVVGFDGEGLRQITREPGFHDAVIDHAHERFVDIHQSPEAPARLTLRALEDGAVLRELPQVEDPRVAALHLRPPQLVKLQSRDGVDLHGAVYAPEPGLFG